MAALDVDRPWRRRFRGIVLCTLASGPILWLLGILYKVMVHGRPPDWNLSGVLHGVVLIQIVSFPILVIYAVVVAGLRRINADSLLVTSVVGALAGLFSLLAAIVSLYGWPILGNTKDVRGAIFMLAPGAIDGALYWCLVVRRERKFADELQRASIAIRAME